MTNHLELDLYVAGAGDRSNDAVRNLTRICEQLSGQPYMIRVIDVLQDPDAAERQRILATPTVLRRLPLPTRRMIGDFVDTELVARQLDLVLDPDLVLESMEPAREVAQGDNTKAGARR